VKAELRTTTFLESLDPNVITNIIQRWIAEYLNRWARPIDNYSFSREVPGPWSSTLEDFNSRIRTALIGGKVAYGTCQCQCHIQDTEGDQYWWIRVHLQPVPNLRISADDIDGNIDKDGLRLQENALISLAKDNVVNLAQTKLEYVGRLPIIYLYYKLANCGMIVPSIHVEKKTVEPKAIRTAVASLRDFLEGVDIDLTQSIRYANILERVRLVDDVVKANLDVCRIWIESLGCCVEEWLK